MTQSIEVIRIGEDEIHGVRGTDGQPWIVVRRACEVLGIDSEGQRQRLISPERSPWAVACMIQATGPDGKIYSTFCLHVDSAPMWLATIDASRCAEEVRGKIFLFQKQAAKVLADWAYGRKPTSSVLETREQRIALALVEAQQVLAEKDAQLLAQQNQIVMQQQQIQEAQPKVTFYDKFADTEGLLSLQNAARSLGQPPNKWISWLKRSGYIFYQGRVLVAQAKYFKIDYFTVRVRMVENREYIQTFVTPKGLEYFAARLPFPRVKDLELSGTLDLGLSQNPYSS